MSVNRQPISGFDKGFMFASEDGTRKINFIELIGAGGTGLAYKCLLQDRGTEKYVVIKEYYPDESGIAPQYIRQNSDGKLIITADNEEERERELKRQKENVERELEINHALFLKNKNNNPYMYNAELFCTYGDSSYILIDTSEGCTLKSMLNSKKYLDMDAKSKVIFAISYMRRFLVILNHLFSNEYVHGDLKPENIYIAGKDGAEHIYFLDFGSVFLLDEYKTDIEKISDKEKIEMADSIIRNEGVGASSEGYRNGNMIRLIFEKNNYHAMRGSVSSAEALLKAINEIDISVDLYSLIKIFYQMVTGEEYSNVVNRRKLKTLLGDSDIILDDLLRIMQKNEEKGYFSVNELLNELDILETILNREGHPKVLLYGLKKGNKNIEFDERLFGEIIEK